MATDIPGFPQNKLDYKVTLYNGAALLPHITTPSQQLQNGMLWTTTAGLFVRINGTTVGPLSGASTIAGWTPSLNTASPNNVANASRFLASGGTTNQHAVLQPKGTGSVGAQLADGLAGGGDSRGDYAVDWQMFRDASNDVASGSYASIGGGYGNRASVTYAAVGGGLYNRVTGNDCGAIGGGNSNLVTSSNGAIGGGQSNTVSGTAAVVAGGDSCLAQGNYSGVTHGRQCAVTAQYSRAGGAAASDRGVEGADAFASASVAGGGDFQKTGFSLGIVTTNATVTTATTTASATPSAANQITLPPGSAYRLKGHAIARQATTGDCKSWDLGVTIKQGAAAANTAIVGSAVVTAVDADTNAATWTMTLTADTTTGCLSVKVTGQSGKTIKWSIRLDSIEVVG